MRITLAIAGAASDIFCRIRPVQINDGSPLTRKRYLPEYTASGDLMLPKNFQ